MKRYSRVSPPDFLTSSPAAAADPPVAIKSLATFGQPMPTRTFQEDQGDILDDDDFLPRSNGASLHLKLVHSILLLVLDNLDRARQLAALPHGDKGSTQTHSDDGTKEEASGIKTHDDIGLHFVCVEDVGHEMSNETLKSDRIAKDGENVEESDALFSVDSGRVSKRRRRGKK